MINKKFNVLIIGAGNIGSTIDNPHSKNVLSHAHGFSKNGFCLLGFVDSDVNRAKKAALKWGCHAYESIDRAFMGTTVDIVCVCSPDDTHYQILNQLLNYQFRLVLSEKPLANNFSEAKKISALYKQKDIPIAVNYTRRYIPQFMELRKSMQKGKFGNYLKGYGIYNKGLFHNGSHMVDLLRYLLGDISRASKDLDLIYDYSKSDPSIGTVLTFKNSSDFIMQCTDSRLYTVFELDLLFSRGRIRIDDSRHVIEIYGLTQNTLYKNHRNLELSKTINTGQNLAMKYVAKNIHGFLSRRTQLDCDAEEALEDLKICSMIQANIR